MNFLVISTLIFIIAILVWVIFSLIEVRRKIKLSKERPASDRLEKAINYLQKKGKITSKEYQKLVRVSDSTATKDLDELEKLGLIEQIGKTGRGVHYVFKIQ